jgi:hypothetical protein
MQVSKSQFMNVGVRFCHRHSGCDHMQWPLTSKGKTPLFHERCILENISIDMKMSSWLAGNGFRFVSLVVGFTTRTQLISNRGNVSVDCGSSYKLFIVSFIISFCVPVVGSAVPKGSK